MDNTYLWLKALHVIAFISWMAGQMYLPRLFVYHAGVPAGSEADKMLQTMERKLLRYIMNPAMILTLAIGLWLAVYIHAFSPENGYWLHAKLALVLGLVVSHGMMARWRKRFARDANAHSAKFYKIFNELQTVLMIGVVIFAVVKPI